MAVWTFIEANKSTTNSRHFFRQWFSFRNKFGRKVNCIIRPYKRSYTLYKNSNYSNNFRRLTRMTSCEEFRAAFATFKLSSDILNANWTISTVGNLLKVSVNIWNQPSFSFVLRMSHKNVRNLRLRAGRRKYLPTRHCYVKIRQDAA